MITSFIDGRVRIRAAALKDEKTMAQVRSLLQGQDGVTDIRANARTGSLLVVYDPALISRDNLRIAAEALQEHLQESPAPAKAGGRVPDCAPLFTRKKEVALLGGLYGLTLLGAFVNMRVHLAAGALLTLLTAKHLYDRRRCL